MLIAGADFEMSPNVAAALHFAHQPCNTIPHSVSHTELRR